MVSVTGGHAARERRTIRLCSPEGFFFPSFPGHTSVGPSRYMGTHTDIRVHVVLHVSRALMLQS